MATCYLPLLDVLERGAPLTLSLTPVLCDQLEAPGVAERFLAFLRDVRARDASRATSRAAARRAPTSSSPSWSARPPTTARARERFEAIGGDLLGALGPPRDLDLVGHPRRAAAAGHRRRRARSRCDTGIAVAPRGASATGAAASGCPSARTRPWLDAAARGGRRARGVRRPDRRARPRRAPRPCARCAPRRADARADRPRHDRAGVERRRLPGRTAPTATTTTTPIHHHRPWANDGAPYDREAAARAGPRSTPRDFVARRSRAWTRGRGDRPARPVRVRAGHRAARALVVRGARRGWRRCSTRPPRQGLALARLDDALAAPRARARRRRRAAGHARWGTPARPAHVGRPGGGATWPGRRAPAELRTVAAARARRASARCASCWRCSPPTGRSWSAASLAGAYPRERADGHARGTRRALRSLGSAPAGPAQPRAGARAGAL